MKLAVICSNQPQLHMVALEDYSIMIVDPNAHPDRKNYLVNSHDWSLLITDDGIHKRANRDYQDQKLLWYTSGTTGPSKFYRFTQEQLAIKTKTIIDAYELGPHDHYVSIMPLWHGHGQGLFWAALRAKCKISFLSPQKIQDLHHLRPTWISCVPTLFPFILRQDIPSLRFIRSSSQSLPDSMFLKLKEKFQIPILETFGLTEGMSHCFTNPLHGEQRMGTVGVPDGIEARIDSNSHLWIKGPCAYTRDWFDTGDLASQDEKGYYRIIGRSIDQINIKGVKVNPLVLEQNLLERFPNLQKVAIFGSDAVKCLYVGSVDANDIKLYLRSLSSLLHPKLLHKVDDIPTNSNGKVSRQHLESMYQL